MGVQVSAVKSWRMHAVAHQTSAAEYICTRSIGRASPCWYHTIHRTTSPKARSVIGAAGTSKQSDLAHLSVKYASNFSQQPLCCNLSPLQAAVALLMLAPALGT
jgi:hypothetical protein